MEFILLLAGRQGTSKFRSPALESPPSRPAGRPRGKSRKTLTGADNGTLTQGPTQHEGQRVAAAAGSGLRDYRGRRRLGGYQRTHRLPSAAGPGLAREAPADACPLGQRTAGAWTTVGAEGGRALRVLLAGATAAVMRPGAARAVLASDVTINERAQLAERSVALAAPRGHGSVGGLSLRLWGGFPVDGHRKVSTGQLAPLARREGMVAAGSIVPSRWRTPPAAP
jgi:hypothetical protein